MNRMKGADNVLERLGTERRNTATMNLDRMNLPAILAAMNKEDETVAAAVNTQLPQIEKVVQLAIESFNKNGRLIYIGAGTSGRLGVLDAVECGPTFGVPPEMVQGLVAGGMKACTASVDGAEDKPELGKRDLQAIKLSEKDTVVGIAASGRTPYVIGALQYAGSVGANTASICCNNNAAMSKYAQAAVEVDTGPEVLTGSTRLKAGTAQKMVLNMISTAAMIGIGKVYENLMVDLQPTNVKLQERAKRIIIEATGTDDETASGFYEAAGREVKTAIVMILLNCSKEEAETSLTAANGFVRKTVRNKES